MLISYSVYTIYFLWVYMCDLVFMELVFFFIHFPDSQSSFSMDNPVYDSSSAVPTMDNPVYDSSSAVPTGSSDLVYHKFDNPMYDSGAPAGTSDTAVHHYDVPMHGNGV